MLVNVLAGMTSGAVASAIANPTDVLKVVGSDLCLGFIQKMKGGGGQMQSFIVLV